MLSVCLSYRRDPFEILIRDLHSTYFPDGVLRADELHPVHLLRRLEEQMCSLQLLLGSRVLLQGGPSEDDNDNNV